MRVMLIDDEISVLNSFKRIVNRLGNTCYTFENPVNALNSLDFAKPDLIISDFYMDNLNGLEFYKKIIKNNSSQKFVFITASSSELIISQLKSLGVEAVLKKPVNLKKLLLILRKVDEQLKLRSAL